MHAGMMLRIFFLLSVTGTSHHTPRTWGSLQNRYSDVSLECGLHAHLRKSGGSSITCIQWTKTVMDIVSATEVLIGMRCDHENSHRISL